MGAQRSYVLAGNVKPILTATHGMFKENRTAAYALLNQLKVHLSPGAQNEFLADPDFERIVEIDDDRLGGCLLLDPGYQPR